MQKIKKSKCNINKTKDVKAGVWHQQTKKLE